MLLDWKVIRNYKNKGNFVVKVLECHNVLDMFRELKLFIVKEVF